ncbi:MAG TPA: hypothetical protein VIF15_15985 [Polyangiaceae bacterium]
MRSCAHWEDTEALALGLLSGEGAARAAAHAEGCAACASELEALGSLRQGLARRAQEVPAPPPVSRLLGAIEREERSRWRRVRRVAAVVAAAACAAGLLASARALRAGSAAGAATAPPDVIAPERSGDEADYGTGASCSIDGDAIGADGTRATCAAPAIASWSFASFAPSAPYASYASRDALCEGDSVSCASASSSGAQCDEQAVCSSAGP